MTEPEPPKESMDIFCAEHLDSLGPLGFKGLELDGKTICSPMTRLAWDGPIVEMRLCDRCRSLRPHAGCTCGVHAAYSAGHVIDQYARWPNSVVMIVEARGEVILHERGWRAEQCVVRAVVELYAGNVVKHMPPYSSPPQAPGRVGQYGRMPG